jgi:hypothetical protein
MIALELLDVGETRTVDGPGFQARLTRRRDRTWLVSRGPVETPRKLATIERLDVLSWIATSPDDPDVVFSFTSSEAAIRHALSR